MLFSVTCAKSCGPEAWADADRIENEMLGAGAHGLGYVVERQARGEVRQLIGDAADLCFALVGLNSAVHLFISLSASPESNPESSLRRSKNDSERGGVSAGEAQ